MTEYTKIAEGKAIVMVPKTEKISKKMGVFYNPVMKFNRDITISILKQFQPMRILDALAATGVRSIRILKETRHRDVVANDISKDAYTLMKRNFRLNKVKPELHCEDANILLRKSTGFDFIDLDVFGSPNFALDSAIARLSRRGVIAVTATDTSALAGAHPNACMRKYWAMPLHNELMHEIGVRILTRKVQLIGAQYEKALTPVLCFYRDHYYRLFLKCEKGTGKVDEILKHHDFLWHNPKTLEFGIGFREKMQIAGPIWTGRLADDGICRKTKDDFIAGICNEDYGVGFYDIHRICKAYHMQIPKFYALMKKINENGNKAARTHFCPTGIKSDISLKELAKIIQSLS